MWQDYPSEMDAVEDALRLARGMTYKYAAAGVNLGGGKAVIIGDPKRTDREPIFRALGKFINRLGGKYITGEDVGTTLQDMEYIRMETEHVVTLPTYLGGAGDIAPMTAYGTIRAMQACCNRVYGSDSLEGKTVAGVRNCRSGPAADLSSSRSHGGGKNQANRRGEKVCGWSVIPIRY